MFYDKDGSRISAAKWEELQYPAYLRVGKFRLPNGVLVSTVWLGLAHGQDRNYKPLIFESMVFGADGIMDEQERYSTLEEAKAGHERLVEKAKALFKTSEVAGPLPPIKRARPHKGA